MALVMDKLPNFCPNAKKLLVGRMDGMEECEPALTS